MNNMTLELRRDEIDRGWHWCYEWDGLLVGPDMEEWESCSCMSSEEKEKYVEPSRKTD